MGNWQVDAAHTSVNFAVRHMMVTTVHGSFTEVEFPEMAFDPDHPEHGRVVATIKAASISTGDPGRDGHLRSADFLDVETYPELRFVSRSVEKTRDGYRIAGDLTIKDVTRPVVLEAEYGGTAARPQGGRMAGFEATTKISRNDWGLSWNVALESGGWLVGDEVKIELAVELVQPAEVAAPAGTA